MTAQLIATQFPGHGCIDDFTIERSFESQATWVIDVLGSFLSHVIHGCLYSHALTDIWLSGAGIKCLYCMCDAWAIDQLFHKV